MSGCAIHLVGNATTSLPFNPPSMSSKKFKLSLKQTHQKLSQFSWKTTLLQGRCQKCSMLLAL
uniref:Uncharacterized protein n=1 Tax=Arundo donax TaxID=35708 RepID=A0A0A9DRX7_ARUDO